MASLFLEQWRAIADGCDPLFWCSESYWATAGWCERQEGDAVWIQMVPNEPGEEDGVAAFPALRMSGGGFCASYPPGCSEVWAAPAGWAAQRGQRSLLDHQYIYDPAVFALERLDADPTRAVFRKNSRKWPRAHRVPGQDPTWLWLPTGSFRDEAEDLVARWAMGRAADEVIHDDDVLIRYLIQGGVGISRWALYIRPDRFLAVMAADAPWHGRENFRFLAVDPDEPWLDEYARLMYYRGAAARGVTLVNDGGDLGNAGLARFKQRLGPLRVNDVYTWTKEPNKAKEGDSGE